MIPGPRWTAKHVWFPEMLRWRWWPRCWFFSQPWSVVAPAFNGALAARWARVQLVVRWGYGQWWLTYWAERTLLEVPPDGLGPGA